MGGNKVNVANCRITSVSVFEPLSTFVDLCVEETYFGEKLSTNVQISSMQHYLHILKLKGSITQSARHVQPVPTVLVMLTN